MNSNRDDPSIEGDDEVVEVPYRSLAAETLRAVIEEFVTRDGTDYGERERSLESKCEEVTRQLQRGEVRLVFDPASGSVNLVAAVPGTRPPRA